MAVRSWPIHSLLSLLAAAIVLPFIALGALNLHWRFQEDEQRAQATVDAAARAGALALERVFEDGRATLAALVSRPGLANEKPPCDPFFKAFGATLDLGSDFSFVGRDGRQICVAQEQADGRAHDVSASDWYPAASARGTWTVAHTASAAQGAIAILQAVPIYGDSDQSKGILVLQIDAARLGFLQARPPADSNAAVLLVASPDGQVVASSMPVDPRVGQRLTVSGLNLGVANRTDTGAFLGHALDSLAGWQVVAVLDAEQALTKARAALRTNMLFGIALTLAVAWLAALVGRKVSVPIVRLAQAARDVAEGGLSLRVPTEGPREVATVARQFNSALDAMEASRHELASSERRLNLAMDVARAAIWEYDIASGAMRLARRDGGMGEIAPIFGEIEVSSDLVRLLDEEGRSILHRQIESCIAGRSDGIDFEHLLVMPGRPEIWVHSRGQVVDRAAGRKALRLLGISYDITVRRQHEAEIHRLAHFDRLTGLPNRRAIGVELAKTFARMKRANLGGAILYLDLDQFKTVNDALGHDAGDAVLQAAAQRLRTHLREGDTLAHMGGDEFVILLTGLDADIQVCAREARLAAEKFRGLFQTPMDLATRPFTTTISIGVTLVSGANASAEDALRQADTALFRAKGLGRNQIAFFEPIMQSSVEQRLSLEQDLAAAIERDQLHVYLQGQFDAQGGLVGAEALLRWAHPRFGMIPPPQFIQIAEETGQIRTLGTWVLRQVCEMLRSPKLAESPLRISINVSPRQFHDEDFVEIVGAVLAETGVGGERLIFEVTEGLLLSSGETVIGRMYRLSEIGIRFSIDDFGTGYSSLAYLKRLPLWEIKIDKSFVRDVPDDAGDVQIVTLVLSLARQMGLHVVAEGVENRQQADFLASEGCRTMQGYLFGRPQAFEDWVRQHLLP